MSITYSTYTRFLAMRKDGIHEYIALPAFDNIDIEWMEEGDTSSLVIRFGETDYLKKLPDGVTLDGIPHFAIIDLNATDQMVGVALENPFFEDEPGEVIFFA